MYRQVSFYASDKFPKNVAEIKIAQIGNKISIYNSVFPGVRGLTTPSYIVYDYTTSGHTDL